MEGAEGANAFIDCIIAYSKNLETNTVSADLEVKIIYLTEYYRTSSTNWQRDVKYCQSRQVPR